MKIKIVRIDKSLPLPGYATDGSVAFDMYSRTDENIAPGELRLLPSNLVVQVPQGYFLLVAPRSSTPKKKGLLSPHGIGIIDQDYHGKDDEVGILVYNFTDTTVPVSRGERIAQGLILPMIRAEWEEVEEIKAQSRGGFGSTGS